MKKKSRLGKKDWKYIDSQFLECVAFSFEIKFLIDDREVGLILGEGGIIFISFDLWKIYKLLISNI